MPQTFDWMWIAVEIGLEACCRRIGAAGFETGRRGGALTARENCPGALRQAILAISGNESGP